jgi:ATP-dependent helicase/nuclease subunit B
VRFPVDNDSVFLTGRVDRVDRHPEEGWLLLDYKTSEVARSPDQTHRKGRGPLRDWVDLQLPLYRHVAPRLVGSDGEPLGVGASLHLAYYNLPRKLETVGIAQADWTAEELEEADERAREVLRPLLRGEQVTFDAARLTRARVSDDLGPLLGVGILAPPEEDEEEEASDG